MSVEIRRGTDRFVDREVGRVTHHAFSFGDHYDPDRVAFGPMVCHDDHLLGSGRGFDAHQHGGLDVVTYVVEGTLVHTGEDGGQVSVPTGGLAHLTAGSGTTHAEHASPDGPCRFVQTWLTGSPDATPAYTLADGGLEVGTSRLDVVHLADGETATLPAAPLVHAFVATGALVRSSLAEPLAAGDAFLLTDGERSYEVTAGVPTVLLVWSFLDASA